MITMTPEDFRAATGVSRRTLDRLRAYAALLQQWQRRINLVSPRSLPELWRRHMLDAAQLAPLLPPQTRCLADLGSGAGFPGLVLAIIADDDAGANRGDGPGDGAEGDGKMQTHLLESDVRKAVFLREAARAAGMANVTVHNLRIEEVTNLRFDAITARALAPLPDLLRLAAPLMREGATALFPKGRDVTAELTQAQRLWHIDVSRFPSRSGGDGTILRITGRPRPRTTSRSGADGRSRDDDRR